jgi:L-aspartate oxidase
MTDVPDAPLDLLVLGSGVAGLSAAVRAADAHGLRVGVLTKGRLEQATTRWAQGGVAAVLGGQPDSTDLHLTDTLAAGGDLCDADAVRVLVDEGPARVKELIALGAEFDRDDVGELQLAREGGHSHARVVHAGGAATGAEVERALVAAVRRTATAVYEGWFALDLRVEGGRCAGLTALAPDGRPVQVRARHVLVASGGAGQLFAVTTNPTESTGDGIAMALRAGVAVADLEFVQFHPTALHHPVMPRPLLSEALRGDGALLRDAAGERFVDELLPRDKVSRAITAQMHADGTEHVWLDATTIDDFAGQFPTIAGKLAEAGLDAARDWLPVAPAAHYLCGGILADLDGATSLPGLWAAGEAACNGVHGANRLASNSLLDGMVFASRVVEAVERGQEGATPTGAMRALLPAPGAGEGIAGLRCAEPAGARVVSGPPGAAAGEPQPEPPEPPESRPEAARQALQAAMTTHAGVLRSADSLHAAATALDTAAGGRNGPDRAGAELANLVDVGRAMVAAAQARTESRGAHARVDHPQASPDLHVRLVVQRH